MEYYSVKQTIDKYNMNECPHGAKEIFHIKKYTPYHSISIKFKNRDHYMYGAKNQNSGRLCGGD